MAGAQRLFHHRQYLRPPRLRFQALVCTGNAGGAGLWQCVSMMPYAPKTGWTGDVPARKNGQTNKIHLSIRFSGASGSRTLAPVSRPIAFRVLSPTPPLTEFASKKRKLSEDDSAAKRRKRSKKKSFLTSKRRNLNPFQKADFPGKMREK